ncbi:hypothetical protein AURDEDRAFT_187297 [Auricularia subglabra TFB-10046 SS5]|uniref:Uncharacterized protein n=1 Tax=Auricularia subglabra (strain TFB-10046 / SS5) TaxID=717982 RepID=J0WXB5_AURST|nr:hypothetical protein AURDEDRAFT_187297 [Auricularia subglabra TFB-10046 SS5]
MSDDWPPPVSTVSSSKMEAMAFWCASDFIQEIGAVIIDRDTDRVLLVYDELRRMYTLPRSLKEDDEDLLAPLDGAQAKSGLRCSRLPLPRLTKRYIVPPDKNWDNLQAKTAYLPSELITDPFYVSFCTYWRKAKDVQWPDGYQLITYWFSGTIEVDNGEGLQLEPPDESQQPRYMLVSVQDALARLKNEDPAACGALSMFQAIWTVGKGLV